MISLEKLKILTRLQKLPKNVEDLGKLVVAQRLWKVAQSPIYCPICSHWSVNTFWSFPAGQWQFGHGNRARAIKDFYSCHFVMNCHYDSRKVTFAWLALPQGCHHFIKNGLTPASFSFIFSLIKHIFDIKMNASAGFKLEIRPASWPLDHHHGPSVSLFSTPNYTNFFQYRSFAQFVIDVITHFLEKL